MDNTAIIVTKSPVPMSLGAGEFNLMVTKRSARSFVEI
jgi:hypothetical protein